MLFWIYNLCFPFVFLALLPSFLGRMFRRGDYRAHFGERLGWYTQDLRDRLAAGPPRIWIQAVSVGEMLTALKFLAALRAQAPGLPLLLSTTTTTGFRLARERVGPDVIVVYSPIDFLPIVRRAFRVFRPAAVVIVDGGLWPNQLWVARAAGLPTALVNARLSPRSERRFRRFSRWSAPIFELLDTVCVSELTDSARWQSLGVSPGRIHYTGSIKFDDQPVFTRDASIGGDQTAAAALQRAMELRRDVGIRTDQRVLLAGSTHAGEELILAETHQALRKEFSELVLIVAPRHVERTASILAAVEGLGIEAVRRTSLAAPAAAGQTRPPAMIILDTTGELSEWYAVATLVFIGKSLTAIGGQNPAEAISAGKPVIVGPHMENFAELVAGLAAADAIVQVASGPELLVACRRLLQDEPERTRLARAAFQQLQAHRGAAGRTAALVLAHPKISAC